jgi:hypothetical protein
VTEAGHYYSSRNASRRWVGGWLLSGSVGLSFIGLLGGCGAVDDLGSSASISESTVVHEPGADTSTEPVTPTTTWQPISTSPVMTSPQPETLPPTTAALTDWGTYPPDTAPAGPVISDETVQTLAAVLGIDGELEHRDGEHGVGQCIGRLEPRGLCVNVPLWGVWQYFDLTAQSGPGASDEQARAIAVNLFTHLGVDPGAVISIEPNGPLPQVTFSSGALVTVAGDGRIAMVIAGTGLVPPG